MSEIKICSLCEKETTEWCEQEACRACHRSLTLEECLEGSAQTDLRLQKLNEVAKNEEPGQQMDQS